MGKPAEKLIVEQMVEVQSSHSSLALLRTGSGSLFVQGRIGFTVQYAEHSIADTYAIRLDLPNDYAASPPSVFEIEGKIDKEFQHFMADGSLCLEAPVEVRRRFAEHRRLLPFLNGQVIPYLSAYSHRCKYGSMPNGERSHGPLGLLEYYCEFMDTEQVATMKLLKLLADGHLPSRIVCPCGSSLLLGDCHAPKLEQLRPHVRREQLEGELDAFIVGFGEPDRKLPLRHVMSKRMWKRWLDKQRLWKHKHRNRWRLRPGR